MDIPKKWSAGFCVLKIGNEDCTSNSQRLSRTCTNGICADADLFTMLIASKNEQFGDSANTNNLISMIFMIAIPLLIIIKVPSLGGALAGSMLYFGLAVFFTIIGMLSPFILVVSIFGGMVAVVLAVVIGLRGGG